LSSHPIHETLIELAAGDDYLRARLLPKRDTEPGWQSAAMLADVLNTRRDAPHLSEILDRVAAHYKSSGTKPPAALWFGNYVFSVMAVPMACFLLSNRFPSLAPREVWVRFDEDGFMRELAWCGQTFSALPNDPASDHLDCRILPTRAALRGALREQLIAHVTPLVDAVRVHSSLGKPAMWALAADGAANAFAWVARLLGNELAGVEEARLLAALPSPLHRKLDFIPIEHCGTSHHMIDRLSCCLYYKVEGGSYCSNCPHRPVEERISLTKAWMEREAAEVA
jgi:ferric iron reductase protein FhuF